MSYFDLKISRIPIGTRGKPFKRTEEGHHDFLPVAARALSFAEWDDLYKKHVGSQCEDYLCFAQIVDNGFNGDGLRLSVYAGDEKCEVVDLHIPDESIDTLIEALMAVKKLRKTDA